MHCVLQSILKVSPCRYVEFPTKQFAMNEKDEREKMNCFNFHKEMFCCSEYELCMEIQFRFDSDDNMTAQKRHISFEPNKQSN